MPDALDRLIKTTDAFGREVQSEYDSGGNQSAIVYPHSGRLEYEYDPNDRLSKATDWQGGETTNIYDLAGRVLSVSYPNGTSTLNSYDDAGRLVGLSHRDPAQNIFASFEFQLDDECPSMYC